MRHRVRSSRLLGSRKRKSFFAMGLKIFQFKRFLVDAGMLGIRRRIEIGKGGIEVGTHDGAKRT